jgi:3'(2'), 5'-bisphosphate nucleotidase
VSYSNELRFDILEIHKKYRVTSYQRMKSSLKFCVVAAGEFDMYVTEPRACEWDIAAGHAILEHAGGIITDFNGDEILYGKHEFKNPSLILRNKNII